MRTYATPCGRTFQSPSPKPTVPLVLSEADDKPVECASCAHVWRGGVYRADPKTGTLSVRWFWACSAAVVRLRDNQTKRGNQACL